MTGLFETIRIRKGQVPFLDAHLRRLESSCAALGQAPPPPGLRERIAAHAHAEDLVVRVTLDARGERIETRPVPPEGPMRIVFSGTFHESYPHKTTARGVFERARTRVVPFRADEAILLTREGFLAEGCITSVFFWIGTDLCTPSLDLGILPGVGRARLLELAGRLGISVREGRFERAVIEGLPLFLVNAVRGMVEVTWHEERRHAEDDRIAWLAESFWPDQEVGARG